MGKGTVDEPASRRPASAVGTLWLAACSYTDGTNLYLRETYEDAVESAAKDILTSLAGRADMEDYAELFTKIRGGQYHAALSQFGDIQAYTFGSHQTICIYEIRVNGPAVPHEVRLRD